MIAEEHLFTSRAEQEREEQPLFLEPLQLARNFVAEIARQDGPIGIAQERVLPDGARESLFIEPEHVEGAERHPAGIHRIQDLDSVALSRRRRHPGPLQHADDLRHPVGQGDVLAQLIQRRDGLQARLDGCLHAVHVRIRSACLPDRQTKVLRQ